MDLDKEEAFQYALCPYISRQVPQICYLINSIFVIRKTNPVTFTCPRICVGSCILKYRSKF